MRGEARKRSHFKWYVALKAVFQKLANPSIQTDPPACFRTAPRVGLMGTDYERDLKRVYDTLMEQIDTYERNGSGWRFKCLVDIDASICTMINPVGRDSSDSH